MRSHDRSMIAIDSMILMHAYRDKFATAELKDWHRKSRALLNQLFKDEVVVCVSTISICEFLVGIPESEHTSMVNHFNETFTVAPFNLRAAIIAATLVPNAKKLISGDRTVVYADTKIIGMARSEKNATLSAEQFSDTTTKEKPTQ